MTLETQAAFSRRIGMHKSHVTRLKKAGRLVMEQGKVNVEESLRMLEATESPLPHHQANTASQAEKRATQAHTSPGFGSGMPGLDKIGIKIKYEQARKMEAEAEMSRMERDKMAGRLVEIVDVERSGADLGAYVRGALEGLADKISPELAPVTDPAAVHARLMDAVENILHEMSRKTAAMKTNLTESS